MSADKLQKVSFTLNWSPVSESDLAELIDLGLVEMREGIPVLRDFGVFALD